MSVKPTGLPAFTQVAASSLPALAERPGIFYFVSDTNGPVGIALSGNDKRIRFYSVMETVSAAAPINTASRYDELAGQRGSVGSIIFNANGSIDETVKTSAGLLLAARNTTISGTVITETYTFYQANGSTVDYKVTIKTTLNTNGTVSVTVT